MPTAAIQFFQYNAGSPGQAYLGVLGTPFIALNGGDNTGVTHVDILPLGASLHVNVRLPPQAPIVLPRPVPTAATTQRHYKIKTPQ